MEAWSQPEGSQETQSDNLSDHLAGEVRVERVMGHLWVGPHLDKDCFGTYTSCSLRKPKVHVRTRKTDWGH